MSKIAFVFPGQGAQYVGMGKDFYENVQISKEVFDKASEASGLDIPALCFEENEKIHQTEYTQIAMLATEVAILKALEEKGMQADVAAGLSLGEYAAIVASGAMSMEDAFRVVRQRGIFMQEAVPTGGAMAAVLGLTADKIDEAVAKAVLEGAGIVSVANYNCPGQIVITGQEEAVAKAGEYCKEAGAKRVLPLKVSGPFHSVMMEEAGVKLLAELEKVSFNEPEIPYVANLTAEYVHTKEEIKELLVKQISGPVRFLQSVENMIADGVDTFVEIGPGKTVAGFVKKINRDVKVINVEHFEDLTKCVEE